MRNLRRTLASIVLAAPMSGCIWGPGACPKTTPLEETVDVPAMPDAQTAQDLMNCKLNAATDAYACEPLCRDIYNSRYTDYRSFDTCERGTDSPTGAHAVH